MRYYRNKFIQFLKNSGIPAQIITEILKLFHVKIYEKKICFVQITEVNRKIGFLAHGLFYVYKVMADGNLFTRNFIVDNQIILAAYENEIVSEVAIKALQKSYVLEADYSAVLQLYDRYPILAKVIRVRMQRKINLICSHLETFATATAAQRYQLFQRQFSNIEKQIPQYIIASYLGITPTQLSRIRKKMKLNCLVLNTCQ